MKRILLALLVGVGVYTVATATTSNYGGSGKNNSFAQDTLPKKDTTKKKDTTSLNILAVPKQ